MALDIFNMLNCLDFQMFNHKQTNHFQDSTNQKHDYIQRNLIQNKGTDVDFYNFYVDPDTGRQKAELIWIRVKYRPKERKYRHFSSLPKINVFNRKRFSIWTMDVM